MRLEIQVQHIDVLNMPIGTASAVGLLFTNITGPPCTSTPNAYPNVAGYHLQSEGTVTVRRDSADKWTVELLNHPLVVGEWTSTLGTGKKCVSVFPKDTLAHTTVTATLTWRRFVK
jgi:hypothetical protein